MSEEQIQEHSSDALSEQSQEGRSDNEYKPVVPVPAIIELSKNNNSIDTEYPDQANAGTTSTPGVDERRNSIQRVPPFTHPHNTFPESLDESPAHACPNESTDSSSEQATTLIMTLSDSLNLMDRLQTLCTRVWKMDPIVVVVKVPPEASKLHVEREILSMCPHLEVLVYTDDLAGDMGGQDYGDEGYDYNTGTGGEDDDGTPQDSTEHNNFAHNSPPLPANNDNESGDIYNQDTTLNTESSPGQTQFDRRIGGETEVLDNVDRTSSFHFGRRQLLQSPKAVPLTYLHNHALARVQTSHVLILDESVWPMEDLDMNIRSAYSTSAYSTAAPHHAALLLPKVLTEKTDLSLNDLPDCLREQSCHLRGLESEEWDGTTKLLPCIHSITHFEPYLVMPWCAMLEPNANQSDDENRYLRYRRRQLLLQRPQATPLLSWHDERLTEWTWRLAQADQIRYAGLAFWLGAGFVYGEEQENRYNNADDVIWRYFHERVVDRFGDDSHQVPVCTRMIVPSS